MQINDLIIAKKTLRSNWLVALVQHNTVKQLDDCQLYLHRGTPDGLSDSRTAFCAAREFLVRQDLDVTYSVDKDSMWADRGWFVFEIQWKELT